MEINERDGSMNCFVDYVCNSLDLIDTNPSVAMALACIVVDATAKKHFQKKFKTTSHGRNSSRYKTFLKDYQSIVLGSGKIKIIAAGKIKLKGTEFDDIIYQIRCALLHEASLNTNLTTDTVGVQNGIVIFDSLIKGLLLASILAEVNSGIISNTNKKVEINHNIYNLDDIWGKTDIFWNSLKDLTDRAD